MVAMFACHRSDVLLCVVPLYRFVGALKTMQKPICTLAKMHWPCVEIDGEGHKRYEERMIRQSSHSRVERLAIDNQTCQSNTHRILVSQVNWYWFYRRFSNTLETLLLHSLAFTRTHAQLFTFNKLRCRRWVQLKVSVFVSRHVYLAQKATWNTDKTTSSP